MYTVEALQKKIQNEITQLNFNLNPEELYEPINYILSLGGKRLRPLFVLLGCDMFGGNVESALKPAVGIEIFHNFTLLHDDIMDNAPLRRSMPSVHQKWSSNIAILAGDAMFVKAYQLIMQVQDHLLRIILDLFNTTAIYVCEGQQLDMNFETTEVPISIEDYIAMIELKTAVLLAASLKIGALIGNASEQDAQHLYEFGKNMGIAFQLQDDLLDVYGQQDKFGKKPGGDILSNKKTFLLLKAFETAHGSVLQELQYLTSKEGLASEEKITAVTTIYNHLGVKELARQEIECYYNLGLDNMKKINVTESYKQELLRLSESLLVRET